VKDSTCSRASISTTGLLFISPSECARRQFNVETVTLLDKDYLSVDRLRAIKNKKIEKMEVYQRSKPAEGDTIFVVTERLPLTVSKNKQTGELSFEWLSFAADTASRSFDPHVSLSVYIESLSVYVYI
jgi:hypothetical protein